RRRVWARADLDVGERKAVAAGKLVPVYFASSTIPSGIAALLDGIVDLAPAPADRAAFKGTGPDKSEAERPPTTDASVAALVFKTHIDPHADTTSRLRVLSGRLRR